MDPPLPPPSSADASRGSDGACRLTVVSLRPQGQHGGIRRAAAAAGGGRVIALSPWRLKQLDDAGTRERLAAALNAPAVVFTSPAAVRAAAALQPLRSKRGQQWFAVGQGTAAALQRAGIADPQAPSRMDSEGLLGLPGLQAFAGRQLGLVTAPGGRGTLQPALQARGAEIIRADVYQRVPLPPSSRALASLRSTLPPPVLLLSSGEALQLLLSQVSDDVAQRLLACPVAAASERLAALASGHGFRHVEIAEGPLPWQLVAAAQTVAASRLR